MKVKSESEDAQSCPTLHNAMDCSPPGSSVHGIFQARVLEWGAITFSTKYMRNTFKRDFNFNSDTPGKAALTRREIWRQSKVFSKF